MQNNRAKTDSDINHLREAGLVSTKIMRSLVDDIVPGANASDIDQKMEELCEKYDVQSAFKGVGPTDKPFPSNLCIGVNERVLHGIPKKEIVFKDGDVVKLDMGIVKDGYYTDHCVTVGVGELSKQRKQLIDVTKFAVESAVKIVKEGVHTGDLGHKMESIAAMSGFDVLKGFVGHGIGKSLHEEPEIPAYGEPGQGEKLVSGEVICVEAQVVAGSDEVTIEKDGWTVITKDGADSAMFEYMVLVKKGGYEILTPTHEWELS